MHAHVTMNLPRRERVALLRIPKGLSGKSWLTKAQDDEPLAAALLQVRKRGNQAPAIGALIDLGEPLPALLAASSMLHQGEAELLYPILDDRRDRLPELAIPILIWAQFQKQYKEAYGKYAGRIDVSSRYLGDHRFRAAELAWHIPHPAAYRDFPDLFGTAHRLYADVTTWTPVRTYCARHCPSEVATCTVVGAGLLVAPFAMQSPLERLIANDRYWASDRIESDLARATYDVSRVVPEKLGSLDGCFIEAMRATQSVFGTATSY